MSGTNVPWELLQMWGVCHPALSWTKWAWLLSFRWEAALQILPSEPAFWPALQSIAWQPEINCNWWKSATSLGSKRWETFHWQCAWLWNNNVTHLFPIESNIFFSWQYIRFSEDSPFVLFYLIMFHSINYQIHQIYLCNSHCKNLW